jgi:CheY-specific phosphatase CheX
MKRNLLYYPTINIPKDAWLKSALLYWDEVSSIVPSDYNGNLLLDIDRDIEYLIDIEVFRPIRPETLVLGQDNWEDFEKFKNEFKEVVVGSQFQRRLQQRYRVFNSKIHSNKIKDFKTSKVHSNKTSDGLYYFLEEIGLAKRIDGNEWIQFEQNTALLYMSLLAKYLADIDEEHTSIGTDNAIYENFNFQKVSKANGFPVASLALKNILPVPKSTVSIEKIIKFKEKRKENLKHFNSKLSEFQKKTSSSESNSELKETVINFQDELVKGVNDLTQVLGESNIETALKTVKTLISLKSPTLIASTGAIINSSNNFLNLPIELTGIGIGIMGGIELSTKYIELRNKNRAYLRQSPFSYLYHASNSGIINRM